ncbi:hypothetical protein GCM10022399_42100 [Terrabacter ginsenosidimutans]|uniref:LemA family protein n=1 Tax=Terrabacter ginsenosidimutans TaxID=490575 RepID=A0ABP7EQ05_9MICO
MVNELDEVTGPTRHDGRDVNVIDKQIPATIGAGTRVFEAGIWVGGVVLAACVALAAQADLAVVSLAMLVGLVPGLVFQLMKTNAGVYLRQLEQKVQADASQIDNYLEQRVQILQNLAQLVTRSVELDKQVMTSIAAYRAGLPGAGAQDLNDKAAQLDTGFGRINVAFEAYPELRSHANIAEAMRQNAYLQKEVTAARTLYNDTVATWNRDIFAWPTKVIVASNRGYTTRIPFTASLETKAAARDRFFGV